MQRVSNRWKILPRSTISQQRLERSIKSFSLCVRDRGRRKDDVRWREMRHWRNKSTHRNDNLFILFLSFFISWCYQSISQFWCYQGVLINNDQLFSSLRRSCSTFQKLGVRKRSGAERNKDEHQSYLCPYYHFLIHRHSLHTSRHYSWSF